MSQSEKLAVIEQILTQAAEELGDITGPVMSRYYQQYPQAGELFKKHGGHGVGNLEGEMVSQALYCLMWWFESQGEIEFLIEKSVPHHSDELNVSKELYLGLLQSTTEIIEKTIPPQNNEEITVWRELCNSLAEVIHSGSGA